MLSKISFDIAWQLSTCRGGLEDFFHHAKPGEIMDFTHHNFYYSYPSFGRIWPNGLLAQFHQVHTCCSKCQAIPERNFAGVGSFYLFMQPYSKALLLCDEHSAGLPVFGAVPHYTQLSLF